MSGPNDGYLVGPAGRTTFTVGFHVIKESCEVKNNFFLSRGLGPAGAIMVDGEAGGNAGFVSGMGWDKPGSGGGRKGRGGGGGRNKGGGGQAGGLLLLRTSTRPTLNIPLLLPCALV